MLRFAFLLGLVFVVSCGSDGGPSPDGGISGDGCEECGAFEGVLESICGGIDRCPDFVYPIGYRSQGECVAILAWATTCFVDDDGQDVDEAAPQTFVRRIPELSESDAQACSDYINGASCDELNALMQGRSEDTPCVGLGNAGEALSGNIDGDDTPVETERPNQEGDSCNGGHEDCDEGLYCHHANSLIEGTFLYECATCKARPKLGEACRPYYEPCVDALRCLQQEGETGYDYYGVCSELAETGEHCNDQSECASGFCWEEGFSEDWECRDGGGEGQPCSPRGTCLRGYVCVGPGDARICTTIKENGEDCTYAQECSSRECDTDGKCGIAVGSEERCSTGSACRSGYCDPSVARCAATLGLGEACQNDEQCGDGVCGRASNTCIEDFCGYDADCADTQYCGDRAECRDKRAEGSSCASDYECLSNYCNNDDRCGMETAMSGACQSNSQCYPWGACEGGMCVPLKDPGEACTGLQSCKPPFVCQNGRCELINISCVPAKVGEPCASLRVCEADATCDFVNGIVCKPRGGQGEVCLRSADCQLEYYCAGSRTCELRPSEGDACDSDMPCAAGYNCVYDEQTSESSCFAAPIGNYCNSEQPCPGNYHCEGSRCAPPLALGDGCDPYAGDVCPSGTYCDDSEYICKADLQEGASCTRQTPCADAFHCNETLMQCVDDLPDGTPCDYPGADCIEGYGCVPDDPKNTSGPKTCRKLRELGEACMNSLECLSGWCLIECDERRCFSSVCAQAACLAVEKD